MLSKNQLQLINKNKKWHNQKQSQNLKETHLLKNA